MTSSSLANQFLIAMPGMTDSNFSRTVTVICQHDSNGALGVVINRPTNLSFNDVFEQLGLSGIDEKVGRKPVFFGGPVHTERGLILHEQPGNWEYTIAVSESLGLTTSRDILEAIAEDRAPGRSIFALGYAGWGEGQLESEILQNGWLHAPVDHDILFDIPLEERWEAAMRSMGINLSQLSAQAGHA